MRATPKSVRSFPGEALSLPGILDNKDPIVSAATECISPGVLKEDFSLKTSGFCGYATRCVERLRLSIMQLMI